MLVEGDVRISQRGQSAMIDGVNVLHGAKQGARIAGVE